MNITEKYRFSIGRDLWLEYRKRNPDCGLKYTNEGIKSMSKSLDLTQEYVKKCMDLFLFS